MRHIKLARSKRLGATAIAVLISLPAISLGATPTEKCNGAKAQALGVAIDAQASCQAAARLAATTVDASCLQKADAKLRSQYAKAEKAGACPGDADGALAVATSCVASFDAAVAGTPACVAAKIKAAGKKAAGKKTCAKKNTRKGAPLGPCLDKVEAKFVEAVAKAEKKTSCSGTAEALEAVVDACLGVLPPAVPCSGGDGYPSCDGTCAIGLSCRPFEVFENGASVEQGCSCVDVEHGPECGGPACGTDRHCDDPTFVCERWMTGAPAGCDHMACQPAMTTPTTLPSTDKIVECQGGSGFPTCNGTCDDGLRCQGLEGLVDGAVVFYACICVDPRGPRCDMPADDCVTAVVPSSHCADPTKTCIATLEAFGDAPVCTEARCDDPPDLPLPPTTTYTTTSTTVTTSTSSSTSSTSTTVPCTSTPATSGCFTDLGNCTILDTCTGLQWEKKSNDIPGGLHDVTARYPWSGCCDFDCSTVETHCQPDAAASATCFALSDAGTEGCGLCTTGTCQTNFFDLGATTTVWGWLNQVNADAFAGHDDWRLAKESGFNPGPQELESILLMPFPCTTDPLPCIDPIFGPTMAESYWSATTKGATGPTRPSDGWFVNFLQGFWGDSGKWGPLYVRAVRDAE